MADTAGAGQANSISESEMRVRFGALGAIAPEIACFLRYWRKVRGDRALPRRVDITPTDIPPKILPNLLLTEALDGGARHRYRLVGTEIDTASRRSLTGSTVDEAITNPTYRTYILGLYETVMTLRRPLFSVSNFAHPDLTHIVTQRIMCPLSPDGVTVNMIISCQVFDTHPNHWPDAAVITPGAFQKLFEAEILQP